MKSKKWIWVTLTVLLTLVVLAGVAGAGFRMGVMQSAAVTGNSTGVEEQFQPFGHPHSFGGNFDHHFNGDSHMMQGFNHDGFDHGRGSFVSPIFGLIKLVVLGVLIWLGFKYVKNSGWRLTRDAPQPAPDAEEKKA